MDVVVVVVVVVDVEVELLLLAAFWSSSDDEELDDLDPLDGESFGVELVPCGCNVLVMVVPL